VSILTGAVLSVGGALTFAWFMLFAARIHIGLTAGSAAMAVIGLLIIGEDLAEWRGKNE
jgi:hypothetical protein